MVTQRDAAHGRGAKFCQAVGRCAAPLTVPSLIGLLSSGKKPKLRRG